MTRHCRLQRGASRGWVGVLALVAVLAGAPPAGAESTGEPVSPGAEAEVPLDRLLQIPQTLNYRVERRGGATQGEWRERFQEGRSALEQARDALTRSEEELAGLGGSSEGWQLAPPGSKGTSEAPLSYQLKMQIRREREEVDRSEKRLRDLEIEANLADVPEGWRR